MQQHLDSIHDVSNRGNAEKIFKGFEEFVSPRLPSFRRGIIHADLNGTNIIVARDTADHDEYRVNGFIDFNDSIFSCIIFELSICLAHIMRNHLASATVADSATQPLTLIDTLNLTGPLISGYNSILPLTYEELDSLYYIILARLLFIAINSERVHRADPENTMHIVTSISDSWNFINHMLCIPKETVDKLWTTFL